MEAQSKSQKRMRGLKTRARLWGVLALLSLGWICYGLFASGTALDEVTSTPVATVEGVDTEDLQDARAAGATIGAGIGITFFLCSGIPFLILFLLLAWRNNAGYRNEERHLETLNVRT